MAAGQGNFCLQLIDITIEFAAERGLHEIDLAVAEREIVSVIGPNGAGKTTLFNIICGQLHPHRGTALFCGRDITRWPPHRICRAGIARTFQIPRLFPEMSALENVLIGLWFGGTGTGTERKGHHQALQLLDLVGLVEKRDAMGKDLTLSEQRRLELARALGTGPQLVLLDEFAAGLSPQAIAQTVELLKTLRSQGCTLLVIDHFLSLTTRVSDRLIALDQGKIIITGKPSEVLQSPAVAHAYLGEPPTQAAG